ncbi:unnamed protein product [Mytilus coruscus]|uniref:B box-type domain-containing protein n=1 Tax=Mytilus coruscus TaxID=42192 RepID=A0A6J8DR18_MYTCO|nr:unnamed protein product [Mytilus coruscus]
MATNESSSFCGICQCKDINKSAEEYCPQCEVALCGDCRDNHKISKLSKSHQTISVDNYTKLPSFIKQIKHNCEEHDLVLEFFCKSHDSLCCKLCSISCHKECKEIVFIEDFITPSTGHQSVALDNIEKVLKDLETNICSAIKDRNRNLTKLREQNRLMTEQIKEKRRQINTRFDHLEGALRKKASALEKEYCQKIQEVIAKLNKEKKKVDEIQQDVKTVKKFASNLQIFMGTKAFQKSVSTKEINVKQLYNNGGLNNVRMEYTFNEKLEGFMKKLKTFGDIKVDICENHVSLSLKGDKSAQMFKSISGANSIENINARLVHQVEVGRRAITGCAVSGTGDMLFLQSYKNCLIKYAHNSKFHSELHINTAPSNIGYDLAVVDSNTVAVSNGGNYPLKIYLFDMNSAETRQVFDLDDFCYGLSYHNGSFICCTNQNGIKIFDKSENLTTLQILPNAPGSLKNTYITSNENFIFHSNCHDNSVVCYDYRGQVQWKYSNSLLRKPYGITLDYNSNIYVAGTDSNNIVVISKDGKQAKELIGASDGISNPGAIYFDQTKNVLLVTKYDGVAFLYDVT